MSAEMIDLELREVRLYRLLCSFFGKEQVVPRMRVTAVCEGNVAEGDRAWAETNSCLMTVVNRDDTPKLVFEFFNGTEESIDTDELELVERLPRLLEAVGVGMVTLSEEELDLLTTPGVIEFHRWLSEKLAIHSPGNDEGGSHGFS